MATNRWVDDTYYVDAGGVRVSDRWVQVEEGTEDAPNSDGGWFYLDSSGRVVTDGWRTINNQRYHFDSDGTVSEPSSTDTWFYFQANGRAVKATGEDSYVNRTINGSRYYFDENGAMATGWVAIGEREDGDMTGISTLKYFGDTGSGQMARGWRYVTDDPEDSDDDDQDFSFGAATASNATPSDAEFGGDGAWYYFDNSGVPAYLDENATSITTATTRINGDRYFFDAYGRMRSGLLGFTYPDGSVISAYFGANDSDGRMKTDRGARYTGERNGYLYHAGKLVRTEHGEDLQVFEVGGRRYLVNESGGIQDSNRFYRVYGEYRDEYNNGTIYYVNNQRERQGEVTHSEHLPGIAFDAVYTLRSSSQ